MSSININKLIMRGKEFKGKNGLKMLRENSIEDWVSSLSFKIDTFCRAVGTANIKCPTLFDAIVWYGFLCTGGWMTGVTREIGVCQTKTQQPGVSFNSMSLAQVRRDLQLPLLPSMLCHDSLTYDRDRERQIFIRK